MRLVCAIVLLACGSPDDTPEPNPSPPPTADPVGQGEVPAPDEAHPAPTANLTPGGMTFTNEAVSVMRGDLPVQVPAYPEPVRTAILQRIRSALRDDVEEYDSYQEPGYMNTASGGCDLTVGVPDLVAYECHLDLSIGRGEGEVVDDTFVWRIEGERLREASAEDMLLPGSDYDGIAEARDAMADSILPGADGIVFRNAENGESVKVPYADLGALVNPDSILAVIPHALDGRATETPLSRDFGPPETITVLAEATPLAIAMIRAGRSGARYLRPAGAQSTSGAYAPVVDPGMAAHIAERYGTTATEVPWTWPQARVVVRQLRRSAPLRERAHGPPWSRPLPRGTLVAAVNADLAEGRSRSEGGGEWVFVAASEALTGWIPSALLGEEGTLAPADAFTDAQPPELRAHVGAHAIVVAVDPYTVVIAESEPGESVLAVAGDNHAFRMTAHHLGSLPDVRLTSAAADAGPSLLCLGWPRAGDEGNADWDVFAIPDVVVADPPAPLLSLVLPTLAERRRDRAILATHVTRRRTYYPLSVRGPGRAQTFYRWDGHALIVEEPP